jgi:hypothetical protein
MNLAAAIPSISKLLLDGCDCFSEKRLFSTMK